MNTKLLQKVKEVKIVTDVKELNDIVQRCTEDWILLGAISNPQDNTVMYHLGKVRD